MDPVGGPDLPQSTLSTQRRLGSASFASFASFAVNVDGIAA